MDEDAQALAHSIVETVREPLLILDADLRVRQANRAFYHLFQVAPEQTEGCLLHDLGNGQWNIPHLRRLLEDILPKHQVFNDLEVTHAFPGIGPKVMRLNARRLRQAGSELILLAIEDVTEQRRLASERRAIETRFSTLVKHLQDHAIFTLDLDGRVTSWNQAAEHVLGYRESEVLGQYFGFIFTAEERQQGAPESELETARAQGRAEDERWHLRKDGELFWALGILSALHDADTGLSGYVKILRDMTARKRAEAALSESEARLTFALETSHTGTWDLDLIDHTAHRSLEHDRIFGYDHLLPRWTYEMFLEHVVPEDRAEVDRCFREATAAKRDWSFTCRIQRSDGAIRWIWAAGRHYPCAAAEPRKLIGVVQDITEHKQTEQALQESQAQLRQLASELSQAELRERKRLAGLVHDHLQQLIVAASIQVSTLTRSDVGERRVSLRESAQSLSEILNEMLVAARTLSVELSPPVLDETGLIGALHWLGARLRKQQQFVLKLRAEPGAEPASTDLRFMLFEAVRELLLNVVKYAGVGEAEVVLRRPDADRIEIQVRDQGQGFDPAQVQARPLDETGFGLFSIRERLAHLGGTMTIESAPGQGTRVTLRIAAPAQRPASELSTAAHAVDNAPTLRFRHPRSCRLLVVDDHPVLREGLVSLFDVEHDIKVVGQASDGPEAIHAAAQLAPDVVLMDVNLGAGMDGIEATRQIRAAHPQTRVIGLSMHTDASVEAAMREAGASAYLAKGCALETLLEAIRGGCDNAKGHEDPAPA
ncbi:PAS domain S-box protein [Halochromatium roseum]|uniref:PAS domain S-box protein n=1 Tax=Halochromatium roseum TaxID=391920 RepID=UPI0019139A0A|nr:PAS domain S-box protein [Halochromatium roseum]